MSTTSPKAAEPIEKASDSKSAGKPEVEVRKESDKGENTPRSN